MCKKPFISVVTVSYQAEAYIEKTIKSVLNQTYRNIEYIFKDGDSEDNTNKIIHHYKKILLERGISVKHIVNKDNGIYHAMNQAVKYCEGQYIIFLNADDELCSSNILSDIFSVTSDYDNADIIYGDTDFVDGSMHFLWKGDIRVTKNKCPFCHQSSFVKKEWMDNHLFDEKLQITADYDFIYKSLSEGAFFYYVDKVIARFNRGGISGVRLVQDRKEHRIVQLRYNKKEEKRPIRKFKYLLILLEAYLQEFLFKVFPSPICACIRHWNKKRKMSLLEK